VTIDDPRPEGSTGMTQALLAITYDPTVLDVSAADIRLGTVPASGSGWQLQSRVDAATGQIGILLFSPTPIGTSAGGSLVTIDFHVRAGAAPGATPINLAAAVNPNGRGVFRTAVYDNQGPYTLHPEPTDDASDAGVDGVVLVAGTDSPPKDVPTPETGSVVALAKAQGEAAATPTVGFSVQVAQNPPVPAVGMDVPVADQPAFNTPVLPHLVDQVFLNPTDGGVASGQRFTGSDWHSQPWLTRTNEVDLPPLAREDSGWRFGEATPAALLEGAFSQATDWASGTGMSVGDSAFHAGPTDALPGEDAPTI
jgi:hypothetical protein